LTPAPAPIIRRESSIRKAPPKADRPRQAPAPARTLVMPAAQLLEVVPVDTPTDPRRVAFQPAPDQPTAEQGRPGTVKVTARPLPVLLTQLVPLLRSRQTLRAAFLLHEILGPPLCHHKKVRQR
jgi:hypothetical protein